ncbi:MAG: bifunctional phosphoglucose/phosphomannose isomerase [Candidatus Colwellbacteria bacterium]|nr:bifunctional phosphoglucose/phosphomannose isomerase [Candidatus Colwellbacteria bacterium]
MKDKMREAITNFPKQFKYEPIVKNAVGHLVKFERFALMGMGGSALVGDLIKRLDPNLDIVVHKDYGLPKADLDGRLLIFVSYSGNTEETLDAFDHALRAGHHLAVISTKGKLLDKAKKIGVLYVELPDTGIQPRVSIGLQMRAALALMQQDKLYKEVGKLGANLKGLEKGGEKLAKSIAGKIPLIYASGENGAIAYNWKIKFNETGKIPAFWSILPEANHNEINGFGGKGESKRASDFICLLVKDDTDHSRIKKRMTALGNIYKELGLSVKVIPLDGKTNAEKIFHSLVLGDWTAYHVAKIYGNEANDVPLIEKFKKLIK